MNHCILEVEVTKAPTLRYTQDNKTPITEIEVQFEGLRADDPPGALKVVGWGNMAEELQNRVNAGQRLVVEGRLRMNTIPRQDGTKEKRAELTLSKIHPISQKDSQGTQNNPLVSSSSQKPYQQTSSSDNQAKGNNKQETEDLGWNSSPLIPDTDEIPF